MYLGRPCPGAGVSCSVAGGGGLMRIGLFVTCLTDTLFPDTGKAVVAVLERLGHQVDFPASQTCCGQMHFNTGYRREAVPMARGFAAAFGGFEAVVTPSASCASMVREYYPALAAEARDPGLARATAEIAPRTYELSVFLADVLGVTDVGAYFPHRVTYHPSCHSLRMLKVGDAPLRLLRAVRGGQLVPDAHRRRADAAAVRSGGHAPGGDPGPHRGDLVTAGGEMPTYIGMPSFPAAARSAVA